MQIDTSPDFWTFDPCIRGYYPSGMSFSYMVLTPGAGCVESDPCKQPVCAVCKTSWPHLKESERGPD